MSRLLDPANTLQYDDFKKCYGEILHRWGLKEKRAEVLKFVSCPPEPHKGIGEFMFVRMEWNRVTNVQLNNRSLLFFAWHFSFQSHVCANTGLKSPRMHCSDAPLRDDAQLSELASFEKLKLWCFEQVVKELDGFKKKKKKTKVPLQHSL